MHLIALATALLAAAVTTEAYSITGTFKNRNDCSGPSGETYVFSQDITRCQDLPTKVYPAIQFSNVNLTRTLRFYKGSCATGEADRFFEYNPRIPQPTCWAQEIRAYEVRQ